MKTPSASATLNKLIALSLLLLLFTGSIGLGAVWVRQEISRTANRHKGLERQLADLGRQLDEMAAEIASASSPEALQRQNDAMRLGLVRPREEQVQRVDISPELLLARRNTEGIAFGTAPVAFRVSSAAGIH
jgi:hypothetical protein